MKISSSDFKIALLQLFLLGYFIPLDLSSIILPGIRLDLLILGIEIILIPIILIYDNRNSYLKIDRKFLYFILILSSLFLYSLYPTTLARSLYSFAIPYISIDIIYIFAAVLFYIIFYDAEVLYSKRLNQKITKLILFLITVSAVWMMIQLITGAPRGFYGPVPIGLDGSSANAGLYFFASTCFALIFKSIYSKYIIFISIIFGAMTLNRTFLFAQLIFIGLLLFLSIKDGLKRIFLFSSLIFIGLIALNTLNFDNIQGVARLFYARESLVGRIEIMNSEINYGHIGFLSQIFGNGRGFIDSIYGFKLNMHTQFSRFLVEIGWVGIVMWGFFYLWLILSFIKNKHVTILKTGFLLSFLSTFFSYDPMSIPRAFIIFLLFNVYFITFNNMNYKISSYNNEK